MKRIKQLLSPSEGYVMIVAMFTVALVMMSGIAVLSHATTQQRMSKDQEYDQRAQYAAMAGLDACMGYVAWDPASNDELKDAVPGDIVCTQSGGQNGATYHATAEIYDAEYITLRSTGRAGPLSGQSVRTVVGRLKMPQTTDENGDLVKGFKQEEMQSVTWGGGDLYIAGNGLWTGNILSYGDITIEGSISVCGNFYAAGSIIFKGSATITEVCETEFHENYENIFIPDFGVESLKAKALADGTVIAGDYTPECPSELSLPDLEGHDFEQFREPNCNGPISETQLKVIWVKGDLDLSFYKVDLPKDGGGTKESKELKELLFRGNVVFVVDGNIYTNLRNIRKEPESATIQFMAIRSLSNPDLTATGNIKVETNLESETWGVWVAVDENGSTENAGSFTTMNGDINGIVFADSWSTSGKIDYDAVGKVWLSSEEYSEVKPPVVGGEELDDGFMLEELWVE